MNRKKTVDNIMSNMPDITEDTKIAKVLELRGDSQFLVQLCSGQEIENQSQTLVSLPSKFKNLVYVKRGMGIFNPFIKGSFVLVTRTLNKTKIKGEVVFVFFAHHIKELKIQGKW